MIRFEFMTPIPQALKREPWKRLESALSRSLRVRAPSVVAVRFAGPAEIRRLNRAYRGCDAPTDVLAFPARSIGAPAAGTSVLLGDVVLCPSVLQAEARRRKIDAREESLRLLVHGVLHLKGYDHATPREEARMFKKQEELVKML